MQTNRGPPQPIPNTFDLPSMELNFTAVDGKSSNQPARPAAWRSGNRLVIDARRSVLPDRCPATGTINDLEEAEIPIKFLPVGHFWHRLVLYLATGVLGAGILESRFGELLLLQGAVATKVVNRRGRMATIGWWLFGIGIVLALATLLAACSDRPNPEHVVYLLIGTLVCLLFGLLGIGLGTRNLLSYVESRGDLVILGGAHPDFLAALPDLATRPAEPLAHLSPLKRSGPYGALAHLAAGLGCWALVAEFVLFILPRVLELPAETRHIIQGLAFYGGLAVVHLAVLGAIVFVWLSQRSAEWRLGMSALVPVMLLLLVGAAQDMQLIRGWNAAAAEQIAAKQVQKKNAPKAFVPSDTGTVRLPRSKPGPAAEPLNRLLTEHWYRSDQYRFAPTTLTCPSKRPSGVWSTGGEEFFLCADGQHVYRIQVFGMIATHLINVGDSTVTTLGTGQTRMVVACNDQLLIFRWPQMGRESAKSIPMANVERIVGLTSKSADLVLSYRDRKNASRLCRFFLETETYATERGLKSPTEAALLKKTIDDFVFLDNSNRQLWQQELSLLKPDLQVRAEVTSNMSSLNDVLGDILPKAKNHYFPDPTGRRVMVVGETLTLVSKE